MSSLKCFTALPSVLIALVFLSCHASGQVPVKPQDGESSLSFPKGMSAWSYRHHERIVHRVKAFNIIARPSMRFRYFFPYAGSLDFNKEKRKATLWYSTKDVSAPYAKGLPRGTRIIPIVDARDDKKQFHGWTEGEYKAAAATVARAILFDKAAMGVQVDIEPFAEAHIPFYRSLRHLLNAKGKFVTIFVGPKNKALMAKIFASCDLVILSGYDLNGENAGLEKYRKLLSRSVASVHAAAVKAKGRYMVGIPASSSWGEYEYTVDLGGAHRVETGVSQEAYVKVALTILKGYAKTPEYIGASLWQLSSLRDKDDAHRARKRTKMPDYIRPSVWRILERG